MMGDKHKMNPADQTKIVRNFDFLVDNFDVGDIKDCLHSKGVLTTDDMQELQRDKTPRDKTRMFLLNMLPYRGLKAYGIFVEALRENSCNHVADQLEENSSASEDDLDSGLIKLGQQKVNNVFEQLSPNRRRSALPLLLEDLEEFLKDNGWIGKRSNESIKRLKSQQSVNLFSPPLDKCQSLSLTKPDFKPKHRMDEISLLTYNLAEDVMIHMTVNSPPKAASRSFLTAKKIMRKTVDALCAEHEAAFKLLIEDLVLEEVNWWLTLSNMAEEMFREGVSNWGRVVTLYAFCGLVAKYAIIDSKKIHVSEVGEFLGWYAIRHFNEWIKANGGWEAFVDIFGTENTPDIQPSNWVSVLIPAVGFGALLGVLSAHLAPT